MIVNQVLGVGGVGDAGLINITTDGEPTAGSTDAVAIRNIATNAGWDSISAEAIGNFDLTFLQTLVYPQPAFTTADPTTLPNPLTQGFVLQVDNFQDYAPAIATKVKEITDIEVPEPTTLALFGAGAFAMGARIRRRRRA